MAAEEPTVPIIDDIGAGGAGGLAETLDWEIWQAGGDAHVW